MDSADTIGHHTGNAADGSMRVAASKRSIERLSRSRKIPADDLETFDLVLAMDP